MGVNGINHALGEVILIHVAIKYVRGGGGGGGGINHACLGNPCIGGGGGE